MLPRHLILDAVLTSEQVTICFIVGHWGLIPLQVVSTSVVCKLDCNWTSFYCVVRASSNMPPVDT